MAADLPDLSGNWELNPAQSQMARPMKSATLSIEQKLDTIRIEESLVPAEGSQDSFKFECGTMGKECALKDDGQPVHLSIWHNGPKLVVMELRGKNKEVVTKRLYHLSEDGKNLTIEVQHIVPPGEKPESWVFAKK